MSRQISGPPPRPSAIVRGLLALAISLPFLPPAAGRAALPSPADRFSRLAEEALIQQHQETARFEVESLTRSLIGRPDGPDVRRIQQSIVELKRSAWIHLIETRLSFARARGDEKTVTAAEGMLVRLTSPPVSAPESSFAPQTPDKSDVKGKEALR